MFHHYFIPVEAKWSPEDPNSESNTDMSGLFEEYKEYKECKSGSAYDSARDFLADIVKSWPRLLPEIQDELIQRLLDTYDDLLIKERDSQKMLTSPYSEIDVQTCPKCDREGDLQAQCPCHSEECHSKELDLPSYCIRVEQNTDDSFDMEAVVGIIECKLREKDGQWEKSIEQANERGKCWGCADQGEAQLAHTCGNMREPTVTFTFASSNISLLLCEISAQGIQIEKDCNDKTTYVVLSYSN